MKPSGTLRILLVEDDADDYRLITRDLRSRQWNFVIDWAETLSDALAKLEVRPYDVVVTDLTLPDGVGPQTVFSLKQQCGKAPIVVLTGVDDESVESDILAVGGHDYLMKSEIGGRVVQRAVIYAVQRQQSLNEMNTLVRELEHSQELLEEQAKLLKRKNRRMKRLYKTAHEFVDNVSHDLRTPLTVIKDYVSIIREGLVGDLNDDQREMLDKVGVRADDLNNMVDDLLDVSKLEAGILGVWRRQVDLAEVVSRSAAMLRPRAEAKKVLLNVQCPSNIPQVYCDSDKLSRVITNLAVNAIKFAGNPGLVNLWVEANPAHREVVVGVTDNGPGIDEESLEQIFKRFRQLTSHIKSPVKGFGLGLNIAQQLCRLNLGELGVQSRVGKGSTFSFTVPVADPCEIFNRWLKLRAKFKGMIRLMEITLDGSAAQCSDEFDSFLNCLPRRNDLLIRVDDHRWFYALHTNSSEANAWLDRARAEFARTNRNRPLGPLPDFNVETRFEWSEITPRKSIQRDFDAAVGMAHSDGALS